jgi:hypothetical protein
MKRLTKKQQQEINSVQEVFIESNKNLLFDLEGILSDIDPVINEVRELLDKNKKIVDTVYALAEKEAQIIKDALGTKFEHLVELEKGEHSAWIQLKNSGGTISIIYRFQDDCPELDFGIIMIDGVEYPFYEFEDKRETWCPSMDTEWYTSLEDVFNDRDIDNTLKSIIKADLIK